jgi:hypothetical protein
VSSDAKVKPESPGPAPTDSVVWAIVRLREMERRAKVRLISVQRERVEVDGVVVGFAYRARLEAVSGSACDAIAKTWEAALVRVVEVMADALNGARRGAK